MELLHPCRTQAFLKEYSPRVRHDEPCMEKVKEMLQEMKMIYPSEEEVALAVGLNKKRLDPYKEEKKKKNTRCFSRR